MKRWKILSYGKYVRTSVYDGELGSRFRRNIYYFVLSPFATRPTHPEALETPEPN